MVELPRYGIIMQNTIIGERYMSTPTVQSIDRAFEILEALGNKPEGMLVKELSAQLGLNKSTVSRILATLAEHGYV